MVFTSLEFIIFAAVFFPIYFLSRGTARLVVCLVASYLFYGWWDWRFLTLIFVSTVVDYSIARQMESIKPDTRKILLFISLATNLGLLGTFKYFDFFSQSFASIARHAGLDPSPVFLNLILPVGISFYTFQTMSYTIDVYRKQCAVEHNFLRFAAYVSLFPQLVAGPIVRARFLLPQMKHDQPLDWSRVARGLELVIWGLFLKLCVADRLAGIVDAPFENPAAFGDAAHLIATFGFGFQIYGDFAGYSLIAIGLGRMMGLDFGINFRRPYFASSFSEFWERWHISLSSWLREYLYVSLGGNRLGQSRTFRNLLIVMFLGGLWHGAAWTFVIWGLLHGSYLIAERAFGGLPFPRVPAIGRILVVFLLVNAAWIFFRAENLSDAILILGRIFSWHDYALGLTHNLFAMVIGYVCIAIVITVDAFAENTLLRNWFINTPWLRVCAGAATVWLIAFIGVFDGTTFIYFQF